MKANELMIGDWVMRIQGFGKNANIITDVYRVDAITKEDLYLREEDKRDIYKYNNPEIVPIPLTAEILKKNGFKCNHVKGTGATEEYTDYILDNTLWIIHNTEDWKDTYFCIKDFCRIKYVHELQHALRLCGIDKEIVL